MAWLPVWRGRGRAATLVAFAVVDEVDDDLNQQVWLLHANGYVFRNVYTGTSRRDYTCHRAWLHREILGLPAPKPKDDDREIDHIDGDKMNNRRSNLRVVSHCQNVQNRPNTPGTSSRYRGVAWHKRTGKWQARFAVDGVVHYVGIFDSEDEAGKAVSEYRQRLMPFTNEDRRAA